MKIELETRSVASLRPYEKNAKRHSSEDVAAIAASVQRFGFNDPIGVTPEGVIVEGHGRYMAAQALGMETVPVIVLSGMTAREIDLYRIAHNKIALSTGFNLEALVTTLRSLVGDEITLIAMGFDAEAGERLLGQTVAPVGTSALSQGVGEQGTGGFADSHECIVIWNDEGERQAFETFLQAIRQPGESAADALIRRLNETVFHAQVAETADNREQAHVH
jgi:hypothetical protein